MAVDWYLMDQPPIYNGGFEGDEFFAYAQDGFKEMLDTTMLCDNVEFINSDFSVITPGKAIIQSVTSDTQLKAEDRQILVPIGTLQTYSYIRFEDEIWIIASEPSNNKFYEKAVLKVCHNQLRWQDPETKKIFEYWYWCEDVTRYSSGVFKGNIVITYDKQYSLLLPMDKNTRRLHDGMRFMLEMSNDVPLVYKLTKFNGLTNNNKNVKLLNLSLTQTVYDENTDSVDMMLADYKQNNVEPTEKYGYTCELTYKADTISLSSFEKYSATFYDNEHNVVDDIEYHWGIYTDALIAKADAEAKAKAEATKKQTEASKPASQPSKPSNNTPSTPSKPARTNKDYYGVALAIWNGNYGWGTGNTRVSRLQAKGFDANRVQSIVNQMGREGYVRSGAWVGRYQGIRDLSPYHYNKYAVGLKNAPKAENAWVNELGSESIVKPSENAIVTHIAKGDSVLTADATRNIWDMASDPSGFISGNLFNNGILSGLEPYMRVNNNSIGEVTFNLPNVTNYEEFMNRAKKDEKFEDMIQAMTIGVVAGKSTLAKNKYKW